MKWKEKCESSEKLLSATNCTQWALCKSGSMMTHSKRQTECYMLLSSRQIASCETLPAHPKIPIVAALEAHFPLLHLRAGLGRKVHRAEYISSSQF